MNQELKTTNKEPLTAQRALVNSKIVDGRPVTAWLSTQIADPVWDDFLQSTPLGQFQQSSMWAQYKAVEGWKPIRVVLVADDRIVCGFQILWRKRYFLRIGYVSKGPVLENESTALAEFTLETLRYLLMVKGIAAIIIQPPDATSLFLRSRLPGQFLPNRLVDVVRSTLVIDLARDWPEVETEMNKTTRLKIRQAERRGIWIREGSEGDIPTFFTLMSISCQRQKVRPNPSCEATMCGLFRAFHGRGCSRLTFAETEGKSIAAAFCICFGKRVTLWKKGWNSCQGEKHPNHLVTSEAIKWAHSIGAATFDFGALARGVALALLNDKGLSEEQTKSRDFFFLGFGGTPQILPDPLVLIKNPILRLTYKTVLLRNNRPSSLAPPAK